MFVEIESAHPSQLLIKKNNSAIHQQQRGTSCKSRNIIFEINEEISNISRWSLSRQIRAAGFSHATGEVDFGRQYHH